MGNTINETYHKLFDKLKYFESNANENDNLLSPIGLADIDTDHYRSESDEIKKRN